jgi:hypothetical protein
MANQRQIPITETLDYKKKRAEIQDEINHPDTKVKLDKSVFIKSEEEKAKLKVEKIKEKQKLLNLN